ncbi:5'-nucleotidase [uncultured Kriegella sp.]|uniref:5'-nucleotidase n=1 Tax=uncultured Kriegella sp. TaxID=1798910 RepID=UPI0030DD9259|tara:strand:+ start:375312 stop:376079 length:768 start_codon:yes stop_codon:yes gene_type:complete
MDLKIKHFVVFITIGLAISCKQQVLNVSKIEGKEIRIDTTIPQNDSTNAYIKPFRDRVNQILDSTLAYAPKKITKVDGIYNTTAGNLLADIIFSAAAPIFKSRTNNNLDFVFFNHGGIRSIISQGKVSARTAFEVMPFENTMVVAELSGKSIKKMLAYLLDSGMAHPISGIQIVLNTDNTLASVKIQGKPFDENRNYFVATSDYLAAGGDSMVFFKDALNVTRIDYLIRNAMIDHFKKVDTVAAKVDKRFYKLAP